MYIKLGTLVLGILEIESGNHWSLWLAPFCRKVDLNSFGEKGLGQLTGNSAKSGHYDHTGWH